MVWNRVAANAGSLRVVHLGDGWPPAAQAFGVPRPPVMQIGELYVLAAVGPTWRGPGAVAMAQPKTKCFLPMPSAPKTMASPFGLVSACLLPKLRAFRGTAPRAGRKEWMNGEREKWREQSACIAALRAALSTDAAGMMKAGAATIGTHLPAL